MTRDDYQTLFETLQLDPKSHPQASLRVGATTQPTLVFGGLPSVDLGATINPEFELGDTIGEGGMGVVRVARQLALHREVAVKTLRPERTTTNSRDGLLHEALVTGGLEHPNVVPIYTLGQTSDGLPVIVMKRIEGVPWSTCVEDPSLVSTFDAADALGGHLEIFGRVCQAVHFAHTRGIIHRDIKPENVMVGAFGEVYLVDWGVAVTTDRAKSFLMHVAQAHGICGTPAYMAPEMTTGLPDDLGVRTDVYLLGATLYHVLTGEPPHGGKSLFEIMYQAYESVPPTPKTPVPDELLRIVHRAMARAPNDRYASADELRRAVLDFARHRSSIALAAEVEERLTELRALVTSASPDADAEVRELIGECRFGSEQALKVWPENDVARRGRREALRELVRWELAVENVAAAEAALAQLDEPDEELAAAADALRSDLVKRDARVAQLHQLQDDVDLSAGAGFRALAASICVVAWTVVPLGAGFWVRRGWSAVNATNYLIHGIVIALLLMVMIGLLRKPLLQNHANRRIVRLVIMFAVWVPCQRFIVMTLDIDVVSALVVELGVYGFAVGAVAIMSERSSMFPVSVYMVAALIASQVPHYVYELMALANFLGVGWLAISWLRQRAPRENLTEAQP